MDDDRVTTCNIFFSMTSPSPKQVALRKEWSSVLHPIISTEAYRRNNTKTGVDFFRTWLNKAEKSNSILLKEIKQKNMGSIGEEELVQMVIDFLESESAPPINPLVPLNPPSAKPRFTLQDVVFEATGLEAQVLEKVRTYVRNMEEPNSLKKWVVKRLQMDGFEASLCKTSWVSTFHPKVFQFSGNYEYIDVVILDKQTEKLTRLIVDMDFRSQFELARPTQAYQELTNSLPPVFVGTEERLKKIISLLCSAAKQSLKEKGLHIPPWRKTKYMQSKWLSKNCKKVSVLPNSEMEIIGKVDHEKGSASTSCCPSFF